MTRYGLISDPIGTLTGSLRSLLPNTINPQNLSADELAARGVGVYEVVYTPLDWHHAYGDPVLSGNTITYPAVDRPLEEVKAEAIELINEQREERVSAGMTFGGHVYQTRPTDRENIAGAVQLATLALMNGADPTSTLWHGGVEDFAWIRQDNGLTVMSAATMVAFGQAAAAHKHALIFQARTMKNAVSAATDVAGVLAAMEWV
jgi:hypothetical protein